MRSHSIPLWSITLPIRIPSHLRLPLLYQLTMGITILAATADSERVTLECHSIEVLAEFNRSHLKLVYYHATLEHQSPTQISLAHSRNEVMDR